MLVHTEWLLLPGLLSSFIWIRHCFLDSPTLLQNTHTMQGQYILRWL